MLEMEVATIASGKRITSLKRERNARRHAGQPVMWFLLDKFGQYLVCSQKLSCVQQYVNAHAEGPWDRVHGRRNRRCCPVVEVLKRGTPPRGLWV